MLEEGKRDGKVGRCIGWWRWMRGLLCAYEVKSDLTPLVRQDGSMQWRDAKTD